MSQLSPRALGIIQILLSGVCFGFLGLFGKEAFAKGLSPGEVVSLRFLFAGVLLFILLSLLASKRLKLNSRHIAWSVALGIVGYAVFSYCFFLALSGLSTSLTFLLLYMYPVLVPIGGRIFLGERIPKERLLALPIAIFGLAMLVWGEFHVRDPRYLAFGIASAVFYSIYILCSRRFLADADSLTSTAYIQLAAGVTLATVHWQTTDRFIFTISEAWPWITALAIVCSIAAMSLFLAGLKRLRSWEASILSTSEPITAIVLGFLLLNEHMTQTQAIGAALVFAALIIVSLPASLSASIAQKRRP